MEQPQVPGSQTPQKEEEEDDDVADEVLEAIDDPIVQKYARAKKIPPETKVAQTADKTVKQDGGV